MRPIDSVGLRGLTQRFRIRKLADPEALKAEIEEVRGDSSKQDIRRHGRRWVITPTGQSGAEWFDDVGVSDDFMSDRGQPAGQGRDGL